MKIGKILRSAAAVMSALVIGTFSTGCSVEFGTNPKIKGTTVVAAPTSGDFDKSMKITYADFSKQYDYILKMYGIEDDTDEVYADACTEQRELIITNLVTNQIILHKAKEYGVAELTAQELEEAEQSYNEQIEQQIVYFASLADFSDLAEDEITDEIRRQRGEARMDEFLSECGMTREDVLQWSKEYLISEKLLDEATKSVTMDSARERADEYIAKIQTMYETDVYTYETSGLSELWVPDDARLIKHILLAFDESVQSQLVIYRNADDDENADAIRAEAAAELEDKIAEVQQKLDEVDEGVISLDDVIQEYSADATAYAYYPDGYLVVPNGVTYMDEFQQAAFVPENISDRTVCVTDYGVHIMIYAADPVVSDESIEMFVQTAYDEMKNEEFQTLLAQWKEEYNYEIDRELLRLDYTTDDTQSDNSSDTNSDITSDTSSDTISSDGVSDGN